MRKITDLFSITPEQVLTKGVMAYYVGSGLGGGKVGLVTSDVNGVYYQIKWSNGQESTWEETIEQLGKNNKCEFYTP